MFIRTVRKLLVTTKSSITVFSLFFITVYKSSYCQYHKNINFVPYWKHPKIYCLFRQVIYSAQSGKLSNLCFLTGYRTLTGQRTFFTLGSFLEIPPRSCDNLRHYLRSVKIESWQFSKLIIPIDSPFKCDHFLQKNLTPIVNRSEDTRVQIFRKSGGNVAKLFCIKLYLTFQQVALAYFFPFTEFIKSNILILDSILIKN